MGEKQRTMSDSALVEACRNYHEMEVSLKDLGKRINAELEACMAFGDMCLFVGCNDNDYAVSRGYAGDGPSFRVLRIPQVVECDRE